MGSFDENYQKALAAAGNGSEQKSSGVIRKRLEDAAYDHARVYGEGSRYTDASGIRHVQIRDKMKALADYTDAELHKFIEIPPGAPAFIANPTKADLTMKKATLYKQGDFGMAWHKYELSGWLIQKRKWAQYDQAVEILFLPKGASKLRRITVTDPNIIMVSGWGHPSSPTMWTEEQRSGEVTTSQSRHLSFSPEWKAEVEGMLKSRGAKVLLSLDGYSFTSGRGGTFPPEAIA
jgi:prolyl oligopeptidase PreP (S9A serine peptidase family)